MQEEESILNKERSFSKLNVSTVELKRYWSKYGLLMYLEAMNNEIECRKRLMRHHKYKYSVISEPGGNRRSITQGDCRKLSVFSIKNCDSCNNRSNLIKNSLSLGCVTSPARAINEFGDYTENSTQTENRRLTSNSMNDLLEKRVFNSKKKHFNCCQNIRVKNLIRKFESIQL